MMPFDAYCQYLALKNHFTKDSYDYHKYCGKSRATVQSFYKRKDRMWFEKVSRQKTDQEVIDFFVANFVSCSDPETLWIGDMIKEGEVDIKTGRRKFNHYHICLKKNLNIFLKKINLKKFLNAQKGIQFFSKDSWVEKFH
jgi:hypothetical protein